MNKSSTEIFVGMDVSDKKTVVRELKGGSDKFESYGIPTTPEGLREFAKRPDPGKASVALETGTHSSWMATQL